MLKEGKQINSQTLRAPSSFSWGWFGKVDHHPRESNLYYTIQETNI
jgi:hypothetical protein